jgi:hypothetical protein
VANLVVITIQDLEEVVARTTERILFDHKTGYAAVDCLRLAVTFDAYART